MKPIVIGRAEYRAKVHACWLGKNIGGTLGAPYECRKQVNNLSFFDPVPKEPAPNDDLDLQLVWLKMLEDRGLPPRLQDFADYWRRCCAAYPWNEYGFCMRNLERGLLPPVAGWFENYYVDEMGSPIRSEIWACLCPADPQRAAALAWMDSAMDHAGGEGMWGEMFWAAVESAAFVLADPEELIRLGLAMIPPSCHIARVIREALWCWRNGQRWADARERIVTIFGHQQPCNAIPNHGFTILGWLYGADFGDKLCHAVNCGYDTDCTGATLGSVLGILGGTAGIPKRWIDPIGRGIKLHQFTGDCDAPRDMAELTRRTVALAEKFVAQECDSVGFAAKTKVPADLKSLLFCNDQATAARQQDVRTAVALAGDAEIVLHYNGEPVLYPGIARRFDLSCRRNGQALPARATLELPAGWKAQRIGDASFMVRAAKVADTNRLGVIIKAHRAEFTVLGPGAAQGFAAAANVEKCPTCQGRVPTCCCTRGDRR